MKMRSWIRQPVRRPVARSNGKVQVRSRLAVERLEARLAPAVTGRMLAGGILDIGLSAVGDTAIVSVLGANIDLFDGTTHTDFAATSVNAIDAHGNSSPNQAVTFSGPVTLSGALTVNGLTTATLNGAYAAQSANMSVWGTIDIAVGATLSTSGDISLTAQDAETGLMALSNSQVIVSGSTLQGNNISLSATSTLTATAAASALAQINAQSNALVSVDGSSRISAGGNVNIGAVSTVNSSAVTKAGAADNTNLPVDAAAATSTLASSAIAHVSGNTSVSAGGTVSLTATNTSSVVTEADGSAGGPSAGGATVANVAVTDTTKAFLDGSASIWAAGVQVSATESDTAATTAKSTAKGAALNSSSIQQILASNQAQTSEGQIGLAAAVAVTNLRRDTAAYVASAGSVTSSGPLAVTSSSSSNERTDADGSDTASDAKGGVGVAVAINRATKADNNAYIGGAGSVSATGVRVQALMPTPSTFAATAESGAGATNVGVAGAFALNDVPSHTSAAVIQTGANVDAGGGDVILSAANNTTNSAAAKSDARGTANLGVGASVALEFARNNVADAEIQSNAGLAHTRKFTIGANSTQTATADVEGGADGGVALLPAVAVIVSADVTTARLGAGTGALATSGDVNITAAHSGSATSTAKATAGGDKVAAGVAAAVDQASDRTNAAVERGLISLGAVTVTAQTTQGVGAAANAGAHAPKPEIPTANGVADSLLAAAGSNLTVPIFKTNGNTVGVAAALGLNLASSSAQATIGSSLTSVGALTVGASDGVSVTATGDGSAVRPDVGVDPSKAGIGVGVGVNVASASGRAVIAPGVTVHADGLSLTADNGAGGANTFTAASTSGGGGSSVGVAGSFALNDIGANASSAVIQGGANVDAGGGDVTLSATNASNSTATANANDPAKGGQLGIGASAAVNVLPTNTADAEAQDSAGLTDAGNVTVSATGSHTVTTNAVNGAAGSELGLAGGIAVALVTNDTTARLGNSASPLSARGAVTVSAAHSSTTTTTADGETRGNKVGIGVSIGVAVVTDDATAAADRSISAGGAVTVATTATTASDIDAKASANGAPENPIAGPNADAQAGGPTSDASSSAGIASPTLVSLETTLVNVSAAAQDKASTGIGKLGVAAAVGVNQPTSRAGATIGNGVTVTAGGAVTVSSMDQSSAQVQASGQSIINKNSIGASAAANAAAVDNEASIGASAQVTGSSITVHATLPAGADHDFRARAAAAGGGKDVGAAGSVGVNVLKLSSQASVGAGSALTATTGGITVAARNSTLLQNVAGSLALSLGSVGVGVSAAINVITNSTEAFIGADTRADAPGAIDVAADTSFAPVTGDLPNDPLDLAGTGALSRTAAAAGAATVNTLSDTTLAYIGQGARINTVTSGGGGQSVSVSATDDTTIRDQAGGFGAALSSLAFGLGLDLSIITRKDAEAYIASSAADPSDVEAGGDVIVEANTEENISSTAAQVGAARSLSVAGAIVVNVLGSSQALDTEAYIGDSATVRARGSVSVSALGDRRITVTAGAAGIGLGTGGIGISNSTLITNDTTLAFIGRNAHITALGDDSVAPVNVLTGQSGNVVGISMHGLSLTAASSLNLRSVAAGGAGAGAVGAAGSATVTVLTDTTLAYIDHTTTINGNDAGAGTAQDINLLASDNTTIKDGAGSAAVGIGAAGVGAGADVQVLSKDTEAYLAPLVTARATEHVLVSAVSHEDLLSIAGSAGVAPGGNVGIAGSTSVATAILTTKAYIGAQTSVGAGGNVVLTANDDSNVNLVDGTLAANGDVGASIAGSVAIPIISKTTQAYIDAGATVDALGTKGPTRVRTGAFTASFVTPNSSDPVAPARERNSDATGDAFTKLRVVTPDVTNVQGVAVSATASDRVMTEAASLGVSPPGVGVAIVGSVYLPTTTTIAYIGQGARLNTGAAVGGAPAAAQSVLVEAGSDYYHLGVSGSGAAGLAAANPGWDVLVSTNVTTAYVDRLAQVNAQKDVKVRASQGGDLVSFVAGLSVGGAAVTGSAAVVATHDTTIAFIGAGAALNAGGNVLVKADDDTSSSMLAGAAALGFGAVGAGGSLGLNLITKDTEAFLDTGTVVNALGKNSTAMPGFDGNVDATNGITSNKTINGLAVQAESSTGVFSIGVAGAGGFFGGLAGAVTVTIIQADTRAFIGSGAHINEGVGSADRTQSVAVGAGNDANIHDVDGAVGAGLGGGIAGGVDVGLIRNNTVAYIDTGAHVFANQDIDVVGVSRKTGDSLAISAGVGAVGIAGAVVVYALDGNLDAAGGGDAARSLKSNSGNAATTGGYADHDASAQAITGLLGGYKGDDDSSTRVTNAVEGASATIQQSTPKTATNGALNASVAPEGTSASVHGSAVVSAGRNVQVLADDLVALNLVAGAGAVGLVGVGGAVVVAHIASHTNAYVDSGTTVSAVGDVSVIAGFHETGSNPSVGVTGEAYAGAGGLVGLGAKVVEINDDSQQNAYLNNGAIVAKANQVNVEASNIARFDADAFGVEVGGLAAGAAIAQVNVTGQTEAFTGRGARIGEQLGQSVGSLNIEAQNLTLIKTRARAVAAGIGAGTGNQADSEFSPTIRASLGPDSQVLTAQSIVIDAESSQGASADVEGIQVGGVAVGVSLAHAAIAPTVQAYIESGAQVAATNGSVIVEAKHLSLGGAQATGSSSGIAAGTGEGANINAVSSAFVDSHIGKNASVNAGGAVLVSASGDNDATARASNLSVGIALNVAAIFATATAGGSDGAHVDDGAVVGTPQKSAGSLDVEATGTHDSSATVDLSGGGIFSGTGGNATAYNNPTVFAYLGGGSSVDVKGDVTVRSRYSPQAHAKMTGSSGGIVDVSQSRANVYVTPSIETAINSDAVTAGGNITVESVQDAAPSSSARNNDPNHTLDVSAVAASSGGGVVTVIGAEADVHELPTTSASVGAGAHLSAGGDVTIASTSYANTTAIATNRNYDLGGLGEGHATIYVTNANSATVGDGAVISTPGNFMLQANSPNTIDAHSDAYHGALISIVSADTYVFVSPQTQVSVGVGAQVKAGAALRLEASSNTAAVRPIASVPPFGSDLQETSLDYPVTPRADGRGLGANVESNAFLFIGANNAPNGSPGGPGSSTEEFFPIGWNGIQDDSGEAMTQTTVGAGAALTGRDTTATAVTSYDLGCDAQSYAGAAGAKGFATGLTDICDTSHVAIDRGAKVTGSHSVDIEARHDNVSVVDSAQTDVDALGASITATYTFILGLNNLYNNPFDPNHNDPRPGYSEVDAAPTATISTPNLTVKALATFKHVWKYQDSYGSGSIKNDKWPAEYEVSATRIIRWNADVVSASSAASPLLIVNADGAVDPSSTIKPTFTSTQIIVPNIGGAGGGGAITFVANQVVLPPNTSARASYFKKFGVDTTADGSGDGFITSGAVDMFTLKDTNPLGTFYIGRTTTGPIQIINNSTKNLVINNIDVLNRSATTNNVDINVKDDDLFEYVDPRPATFNTFHFMADTMFVAPTLVDIENRSTTGSPNIILNGLINNPIGATKILNASGSILSGGSQAIVRTNILDEEARNGFIGSSANPVSDQLVYSEDVNKVARPIEATVLAGGNAFLDLTGILRDPDFNLSQTPFGVPLQSIHAGGNIVATLEQSERESQPVALGGGFTVYEDYYKRKTPVTTYFRPDKGGSAAFDPGFLEGKPVAINSTYNFLDATAGNNISFRGLPAPNTIHIQANTNINPNGPGGGHIDASTNGNIKITETAGAMRVGAITSTAGNVLLTVPALPVTGQDLLVLDHGQISAKGTVTMDAGGGVEFPADSQVVAGSTVFITGHEGNAAPAGVVIDVLGTIRATAAAVWSRGDNDVVNLARGQDATPTIATARRVNATIDVRANGGPLTIDSDLGRSTINVGSVANPAIFGGAATFSAAQGRITQSAAGSFLAEGFRAGQQIVVSGTQSNNGSYQIQSVTDITLTLTSSAQLTDETAAGAKITNLHGTLLPMVGPVTVNGGGDDTLNVDDTGDSRNSLPVFTGSVAFEAKALTVARAAGSFVADGFRAGEQILVSGTASNDGAYQIQSVSASTLFLTSAFNARNLINETDATARITNATGQLTDSRVTGLGMGQGITYNGLFNLNVYLGSGADAFAIHEVARGTKTVVDGGLSAVPNTVAATFTQDFQGNLSLVSFQNATALINRDFVGSLTARTPGDMQMVRVGRTLTSTGLLHATGSVTALLVGQDLDGTAAVDGNLHLMIAGGVVNNRAAPGNVTGVVQVGRNFDFGYVYGSLSGRVAVGQDLTGILEVFGDASGRVLVTRDAGELSVIGSLSGQFDAGRNVSLVEVGKAVTGTGTARIGGSLFSLLAGTDFTDPSQGLFGQVVVAGNLNEAQVNGTMAGTIGVGGDIGQGVVGLNGSLTRYGWVIVNAAFTGQVVAMGNVYGDLWFKKDVDGRISAHGRPVTGLSTERQGIVGNVRVDGTLGAKGAIVSDGLIGDAAGGTKLTANGVAGILAAKGAIPLGQIGAADNAQIFANAQGVNSAAIDAIFSDQGNLLFIDTTPTGLRDLSLILNDLAALHIGAGGNLTGPIR
jgi:hypothetical protein